MAEMMMRRVVRRKIQGDFLPKGAWPLDDEASG